MNYEAPKLDVVEIDVTDIIQTSSVTPGIGGGGGENETPFNPNTKSITPGMDNNY